MSTAEPSPHRTGEAADAAKPSTKPSTTVRGHGSIHLIEQRCTSCMICVRECPTWCITVESHGEQVRDEPGQHPSRHRVRTIQVLDRFDIDWSLCMYCGICIEECPFDALAWAGDHVQGASELAGLVHDRDQLAPGDGLSAATDQLAAGTDRAVRG